MHKPCNTNIPMLPLNAYEEENELKFYINDTGLLMAMFGFATKQALLNGRLVVVSVMLSCDVIAVEVVDASSLLVVVTFEVVVVLVVVIG